MALIPMPHIIVLIPGITGSVLKKNGEIIWGYSLKSLASNILSGGNKLKLDLALPIDSPDEVDLGDGVVADALMPDLHLLPGVWKIDGYSKIINAILSRFDVKKGENFFTFPYDWRRDNRVAARRLDRNSRTWIEKWREKSGNQDAKIILVAHSMGGLVSRYFLEVLGGWKLTKALVTFGTPYRGSLNALDCLANGLRKGSFKLTALSELARQFTSIYQLLPIYEVYDHGDGVLVKVGETSGIPHVDPKMATDALRFHQEIAAAVTTNRGQYLYQTNGYGIYPVVGINQQTKQSGRLATDENVELFQSYKGKDLSGDGTVPRVSAVPLELSDKPNAMYAATQHGSLQNADSVLAQIEGVLSGFNLDLGTFRKGGSVALEIEDLFWKEESVSLRARPSSLETELSVILWRSEDRLPITKQSMHPSSDGWQESSFDSLSPGEYRVEVVGKDIETAADAFAVTDLQEEQIAGLQ